MTSTSGDPGPGAVAAGTPATWDRLARFYRHQERLERAAVDQAVVLAAPGGGELVLDVGAGTGLVARRIGGESMSNRRRRNPAGAVRRRTWSGASIEDSPLRGVAVDRSAGMLAAGGAWPAGWVQLRAGGAAVPIVDSSTDVVVLANLLHLLSSPERVAVLAEVARVLAPGGRVVTVTPGTRPGVLSSLVGAAMDVAAGLAPTWFGGLARHDPSSELRGVGLTVTGTERVGGFGYPSLVLRAERRPAR